MISVITPCYNHAQFIGECIKSVQAQTYEKYEHIIVNDGSTDNSEEVIKSFDDSRIKLINHDKNLKLYAARNTAVRASKGYLVVPIDADDMLLPESLEDRAEFMYKDTSLDGSFGYALKIHDDATYEDAIRGMGSLKRHPSRLHAQGMCFRRDVFERFGLYYDCYSKEDKEMVYRLGVHDKSPFPKIVNFRRIHKNLAFYRRHPLSMHKLRIADKKFDKEIRKKFKNRVKQLKAEGITKENTEWLA